MIGSIVLAFIRKNWAAVAFAAVVAAAWMYVSHLQSTIEKQQQTIAEKTQENATLHDNNVKLEAALTASNSSIEILHSAASQTKREFATLSTTVSKQTTDMERRLMEVLREKTPQTCEDSIKYLIDAVGKY